jgi:hypothetical protein
LRIDEKERLVVRSTPGVFSAVFVGAASLACQRDYRFDTVARYRAIKSQYEVSVHATGLVRAGADLSEESSADVRIAPTGSTGSPVQFTLTLPDQRPERVVVAARLANAGYQPNADELAETVRAVGGAMAGPKATLMDGQTRSLQVLEVTFRR